MNKKRLGMLALLGVIGALIIITALNPVNMADLSGHESSAYATILSLLPPVVAIGLALITKEVYTSLFVGIITGALLYSNFNLELMGNTLLFAEENGLVSKLADSWNVGILVFLVLLGILVAMLNKAGGSEAFGRWAATHIKSRVGAQIATAILGVMIFVDDYFNCLTVGSVMKPVSDRHKVSRAKLAYIIDATAAPVCIIAPISSWAAAVTSSVPEDAGINGFSVFIQTIPYNLYAILTIVAVFTMIVFKLDYGPMKKHEMNALAGDLFTTKEGQAEEGDEEVKNPKAKVIDLVIPVLVLIAACIIGMIYTGGFFSGVNLAKAFADASASKGLVIGGFITLIFSFFYFMLRDTLSFKQFADCIVEGFKAMVAPILILALAWTLSGMTNLLGGPEFVSNLVEGSAKGFQGFLPMIVFIVAAGLAFATGTSWGTFGILIPIVIEVFPSGQMMVVSIAACLAGAVAGDHSSPISDTTIMASAGAKCNHVNHVSTQIPYVLTVVAVCLLGYAIIGVFHVLNLAKFAIISLPISIVILVVVLILFHKKYNRKY